jgi:hypothetical protein
LQELVLSDNSIGDEGGKAIGAGLATNGTLQKLYLYSNRIGDEGGKAIGAALATNGTLQELNLNRNRIGAEGGKAIGAGLPTNGTLQVLDLDNNYLGDDVMAQVHSALVAAPTPIESNPDTFDNIEPMAASLLPAFLKQCMCVSNPKAALTSPCQAIRELRERPDEFAAAIEAADASELRGVALVKAAFLAITSAASEQGQPRGDPDRLSRLFGRGLDPDSCEPKLSFDAGEVDGEWTSLGLSAGDHADSVRLVLAANRTVPSTHTPVSAAECYKLGLPVYAHGPTLLSAALAQRPVNWPVVKVILSAGADIELGNVLEAIVDYTVLPAMVQATLLPLFGSERHTSDADVGLAVATAVKMMHDQAMDRVRREAGLSDDVMLTKAQAAAALTAAATQAAAKMTHAAIVSGVTAASMHRMFEVIPVLGMAIGGVKPQAQVEEHSWSESAGYGAGDGSGPILGPE